MGSSIVNLELDTLTDDNGGFPMHVRKKLSMYETMYVGKNVLQSLQCIEIIQLVPWNEVKWEGERKNPRKKPRPYVGTPSNKNHPGLCDCI